MITNTGYSLKRYSDIIAEVRQELLAKAGDVNVDMSDDSLLGILNNIWCVKLAELHELAQALWSAGDIDTAEGIALDRLVRRMRIDRLSEVKAFGDLLFTGQYNSVIPIGLQATDILSNVVSTIERVTLNNSRVSAVEFTPRFVPNAQYFVRLGTVTYQVRADSTPTVAKLVTLFRGVIPAEYSVVNNSDRIAIANATTRFDFSWSNNLTPSVVGKLGASQADAVTNYLFEPNVLNRLVVNAPSLTVTNPTPWTEGRDRENDDELRNRFRQSRSTGSATVDAIRAKLLALNGVQSAFVDENITLVTDANGLPAKSFECTVKGGLAQDIANTIWLTKPAGIQSFGNFSRTVVDSSGKPQTVFYSRGLDVYVHVRVTYALHNEVELTPDIETRMRSVIEAYGDGLAIQEDINPQRIMAVIYNNVTGIKDVVVEVARTSTPSGTPSYTTSILPINRKEEAVFDAARILISQV